MRHSRLGAQAARLSIVTAAALLGFAGSALAQGTVRVDFDLGEGSGSIANPGLGSSGYLLLGFDDANPLLADGTGTFTVTTFSSAELHLEGTHPAETDIQQIGSAYQMGSTYGLSLELNNSWSNSGSLYTEGLQFSFSTDTGAPPLLSGTSSEFGVFALSQLAPGSLGQIILNRGESSELGSNQGDYTITAAITGVSAVPEPASALMWLQGLGAVAALGLARKARPTCPAAVKA